MTELPRGPRHYEMNHFRVGTVLESTITSQASETPGLLGSSIFDVTPFSFISDRLSSSTDHPLRCVSRFHRRGIYGDECSALVQGKVGSDEIVY